MLTRSQGIGRNYREHAKELNNPVPSSPVLFLKPSTSYVQEPRPILCPRGVELHHEVELGVIIGREARDVPRSSAMSHVGGYCLALDMTGRNIKCRQEGRAAVVAGQGTGHVVRRVVLRALAERSRLEQRGSAAGDRCAW